MTTYRVNDGWIATGGGLVATGSTKRQARAELAIKQISRRLPWRQIPAVLAQRVHGSVMAEVRKGVRP